MRNIKAKKRDMIAFAILMLLIGGILILLNVMNTKDIRVKKGQTKEINMLTMFKKEKVTYSLISNEDGLQKAVVKVNDQEYVTDFWQSYKDELIIKKNGGSSMILISSDGMSDDDCTIVLCYHYDGNQVCLSEVGIMEGNIYNGSLKINEDGSFRSNTRSSYLQTWWYQKHYRVEDDELWELKQEWYDMVIQKQNRLTVIKEFPVYKDAFSWSKPIFLDKGTELLALGTNESGYIKFEVTSGEHLGEVVYLYVTDFYMIDGNENMPADEVLDGLLFAD